ncbi:tubulin-folding cofactor B-like [Pocillopora verrucosa]|uniref:tubulin-folding cofactor B-like n=1 Tax=Pocillopora verrucosa TaxID=203993 RepID=UPI00334241A4
MASMETPNTVFVQITSSVTSFTSEKRLQRNETISLLKGKLELITGCSAMTMEVQLLDKEGKFLCILNNEDAMLGAYPVDDNMRLHVVDKDPSKKAGEFEDLSAVEKYEMSTEDYSKRSDSVRAFKQKNKLGQFKEKTPEEIEEEKDKERHEETAAKAITVGSRCEVTVSNAPARRGVVMFVGQTNFKPGWWVGVKYDEPFGKNDGSVAGKRYFTCPPKYGGFIKPKDVTVGDFPEEDLGFEDDEM